MIVLHKFILVSLLSLSITFAYAQSDSVPINTVVENSQKFFQAYPIEKVHLHFDKPYYAVGDTLWFKTYLTSNIYDYDLSKVAYVEVMNSRDSLLQVMRIPLVDNSGTGHLVLDPQWYKQDNYRFRAYTKWMVNFDPAYYFNKVVPIGNVLNNKLHTTIKFNDISKGRGASTQVMIQFRDGQGNVMGNKRVNWDAISGFQSLDKGRGDTDAMGNLTITLKSNDRQKLQESNLYFSITEERNSQPLTGELSLQAALWDADVQFFPEGGHLLEGVANTVAFKAIGSDGLGLAVKGEVVDQSGQTIGTFEDTHAGMGSFNLIPLASQRYTANITFANGETQSYPLPEPDSDAVKLTVLQNDDSQLQVAILAGTTFLEKHMGKVLYVFAQSGGTLNYAAQAPLRNNSVLVNLPKDRFSMGIVQLTLMDASGKPLSERLVFVDAIKPLDIQVSTNKNNFSAKELVNLSLSVVNNDTTTAGQFSISVTDETKVAYDENDEVTILSNLLLTSDLTGFIERPNYYFNPENENRTAALDALLLTQGYRRFAYTDLIAQKYPEVFFLPEQGIELAGTLRLNNGKPVYNGGLLLSIPEMTFRTDTYTDERGRFAFKNLNFTDSARVTINARGNDNYRNMVITMDPTQFPAIDPNRFKANARLNISDDFATYLANSRNEYRSSILIEEVTITGSTRPTFSHRDHSSLSGLSMADHTITGDRLQGCSNLLMCLPTLLTGITYDNQAQLFFITRDYNAGGRIPVQFFLNGMAIDVFALNSIMPPDVEGIEIFLRDELGVVSRIHQNNGVVSIYTKKVEKAPRMSLSEIEALLPKSNVIDLTPLGYVKAREFYVPKYDTPERRAINDLRSTIYWNPNVITDENGKAALEFYNADGRGSYRVVVEGVDQFGNFGRAVYRYQVN